MQISLTKQDVYTKNKSFFKKYTKDYYRLVTCKTAIREKGFEEENRKEPRQFLDISEEEHVQIKNSNNSRARKKVFEYAICNEFQYFITLTFNKNKIDRGNLENLILQIRKKMKNYKKQFGNFNYIMIPELHSDRKNFHFHGLIYGIPEKHLNKHSKMPDGRIRYNWSYWEKHFGFTALIELDDNKEKVSSYITKYMTKDQISLFGQDRYLVSRQLKKPQLIYSDANLTIDNYDFENEHVKLKTYRSYNAMYTDILQ